MSYNYINYRRWYARFDEESRTFCLGLENEGTVLDEVSLTVRTGDLNMVWERFTPADYGHIVCAHEKHYDGNGVSVCFCDGPEAIPFFILRIRLYLDKATISIEGERDGRYFYDFSGKIRWGLKPATDTFPAYSKGTVRNGLRSSVGRACPRGCDTLYDRLSDTSVTLGGNPALNFGNGDYSFGVSLSGDLASFDVRTAENVIAEQYGMKFGPMNNSTVFERPPVGFMTWYAVRFGASEQSILDNSRIQKEKLAGYGANALWVDWEWYHNSPDKEVKFDTFTPDPERYPHGMKYLADRIREDGFVPCVWIGASHEVRETPFIKENPETVLVKRKSWCGDWWFDPTHPKYLNEFIPLVFGTLKNEWGYEAIKWDALPRALDYYDQYHDRFYDKSKTPEQALRDVVKKARETVGDGTYMLSCHGESQRDICAYADIFDAARIGCDIFSWRNYLDECFGKLQYYYPLHNNAEYCDPDNLIVREEFNTLYQARTRASLVSLLGLPVTIGDDLRELSDERIDIIRRVIPSLDVHPLLLESKEKLGQTFVIGCYVKTAFDGYQIADVVNLTERDRTEEFLFTELDLEPEKEYLVYDYWDGVFYGRVRHGLRLDFHPCESKVLLIREVPEHPAIVSTNRHISQGALEIKEMRWDGESRVLSGVSETVPGDEYKITWYDPESDTSGVYSVVPDGTLTDWSIVF